MAPLEDGSSGIEDDNTGARVVNGRLQIIPADSAGNPVDVNVEPTGYSLSSRALLYDASGVPLSSVINKPADVETTTPPDAAIMIGGVDANGNFHTLPLDFTSAPALRSSDPRAREMLEQILYTLQKIETHLALITDEKVRPEDLDPEETE